MSTKIGIFAQEHGDKFGVNTAYLSLIEEVGGTPLIIFPTTMHDFWDVYKIDALLVPGGADVSPLHYGAIPSLHCGYQNPILEYFDRNILPGVMSKRLPIFGICRGLQIINVILGGTLWQDLPGHPESLSRTQYAHRVRIEPKGGTGMMQVNSLHHQGIKDLAPSLKAIAISAADDLVEAVVNTDGNIVAVQWHPEEIFDKFSINHFKSILR